MDIQTAYDKGREHGANAGEWYFDGNTEDATYSAVLKGIEDGDPQVLDTFPTFSFGEWAGESVSEILGDLPEDEADEITEAYLQGFYEGSADMIESTARFHCDAA